ncbi:M1 family peptidase [Segetibacter sp. 3557_3]|uniref:M1 family metallopeptidase n=1 Tax=Segetibacter sp. 3557_3 TaxID=2547429 RepID=UPI0010585FCB|nr:M1 family metallopeptidase [Segetibacter sp. 3557_3]TDH26500.1 M1 family peptidase [Segetibacter sp. 3557_3]
MKQILCVLLSFGFVSTYSQSQYWQQEVNYNIKVSLTDSNHSLDGFARIEYINYSPDSLSFIWFHLWPNAYKNDKTAFSEQLLKLGRKDFYFSKPEDRGYINRLQFKADEIAARVEEDSANIDLIKLILPRTLPPGAKTIITTPFHVKLPFNFSRGGHVGQDYQVTQWFPKPAVYDRYGWHPMPYLDQGEFYSEFGSYDVELTVPSIYQVAATGVLQDTEKLNELKSKGKVSTTDSTTTWRYKQDSIHDFAWFASKDFLASYDTVMLSSGKKIDVFSYYHDKDKAKWGKTIDYAKQGIRHYSNWIGDYPYTVAKVVQGSENENSGGMEYPTITLITTEETGHELDATIVHEIGHNWFYGALASNERNHPWMDEGMNTYYQKRYELRKYKTYGFLPTRAKGLARKAPEDEEELFLKLITKLNQDQPIETPSAKFTKVNYGIIAYLKASRWMALLEKQVGTTTFDSCMKQYYREWKFKHPYPADFKASMEKSSGKNLDSVFTLLHKTGSVTGSNYNRAPRLTVLGNLNATDKYNYVSLLPAVGYNAYDKAMFGAMLHNYQLPLNRLQFFAGAMYASATDKLNGFGRIGYNTYKKKYHVETALSAISYSQNNFTTESATKLNLRVNRLVPSVKLTLFDKDPLEQRTFAIHWKTFLINEDALQFQTIIEPGPPADTSDIVTTAKQHRTINRLSLTYADQRALYPYSLNLVADQGKDFIRAGFTAEYYFNYANNKTGLSARLFAGRFFYLNEQTFQSQSATDRYHLNMTGAKGYEDYTYSDYFIGRNEFDGWMSQQIMQRDGFFKVRTDLLGSKIGKTDDWLMSLNLVTDFPEKINPLSILPIKIPLKVFADFGTYAEAWQQNPASGRFLYDAGLQLSLLGSLVNVYLPILYSKVYQNYFKSTITEKRFQKNIAFSIDIQKLQKSKLLPGLSL